mgnify:CR=1 FL=1
MEARIVGMPARKECPDTDTAEKFKKSFSQILSFLLNKVGVRFLPEESLNAGRLG